MQLFQKILILLSKDPLTLVEDNEIPSGSVETDLSLLNRSYPNFIENISGKTILDFGCGFGYQSIALAKAGAKKVVGLDTNQESLKVANKLLKDSNLGNKVHFINENTLGDEGEYDIVISQNSMEHFSDPVAVLLEMKKALKSDGCLLISFGPPWYAPYGSHMQYFTNIPWINILFPEETVMAVRGRYRSDGARKYEEVESGLNKMTVSRFEKIINLSGLLADYRRYDCVKGMNLLGKLPVIRELFINHISCRLVEKTNTN
jgi:SAM-dependent methyltransferase